MNPRIFVRRGTWKEALPFLTVISIASACFAAQPTNSVPKSFEAKFTGLGGGCEIRLQKGLLLCSKSLRGEDTTIKVSPTIKQWAEFRQALDKVGAWHWRTNYRNDGVMDGTYWSLTITYPDRTVRASGLNSYPDEKGKPGPDAAYTKAFDAYTRALDKLTSGKFMKE